MISYMKATKEQIDDELVAIKMFASNYAKDLLCRILTHFVFGDTPDFTRQIVNYNI